MSEPQQPLVDGPSDPEHDPRATYAVDQRTAARLTSLVVSSTGETAVTSSPIDGAPLAAIPQSSTEDIEQAYARAREAQKAWAATPVAEREAVLLRFHDLVLKHQAELLDLICLESGKARKHGYDEVLHTALTARFYGRKSGSFLRTSRVPGVVPVLTRTEVNRIPKGVVGVISPWNYPLTMALSDALPALAAGNAVVSKPDSQTPLTALRGIELLIEAGLPADVWQVVAGPGSKVGPEMIARSNYICFTGSTATGKRVAEGCADRLIGCSLELGGKNPMVVLRDASVEAAAEGATRAAFSNAGQLCVSIERMFVADEIYSRFVERFVARVEAMSLGASTEWGVDMGTLISQAQLDTVQAHVDDAVAKGARVLTGGRARPDLGPFYFEPTVLEGVTPEMTCFGTETFGPVVSLYRFTDEEEAIARANDGEYGLNASIYSRDGDRARELARRISCGTVNINEAFAASFASLHAPMGGMRESGMGRRQGAEGILRYTETQSVATQRVVPIVPPQLSDQTYARLVGLGLTILKKAGRA